MALFGQPNIEKLRANRDISGLIKAFDHKKWEVRRDAAVALKNLGDMRGKDFLIAVIKDKHQNVDIRWSAAEALLYQLKDPEARDLLISTLKDKNENIKMRMSAAKAIRNPDEQEVKNFLITALKDKSENTDMRLFAAEILVDIDDSEAKDFLIATLKDENENVSIQWKVAGTLARHGDLRGVAFLIDCLNNKNEEIRHITVVLLGEILVKSGASWTVMPLVSALKNSDKIVQALAENYLNHIDNLEVKQAIADAQSSAPAQAATVSDDSTIAANNKNKVLETGKSTAISNEERLILAAKEDDVQTVKALLDAGTDVNATVKGYAGMTPLMHASRGNHIDCVKVLISAGANVRMKNELGRTALKIAEGNGNREIVKLLEEAGAREERT